MIIRLEIKSFNTRAKLLTFTACLFAVSYFPGMLHAAGGDAGCPLSPAGLFDDYRRFHYRIRTDAVLAVPYLKTINSDMSIRWCLKTEAEEVSVPDEAIGVEIPVALDQFRPDYDWRTLNRAPLIKLSLLESGFMQTGPIAFLRDILETGSSFFVAAHFDLMFFLHQKNRLFLVFEASLGKYEPKKGTQTSSFRDYYADVLIDYRLHTYKRVELHWAAGGGVTLENYILNGISIENYTSQIKTGGTIRLNVSEHIMLSCFLFYRFNPDKLVNDSRLLYGLSAGVRL